MEHNDHDLREDQRRGANRRWGERPYENEFMQRFVLKWGKITSVVTLEDTQRFVDILPTMAKAGFPDATCAPITDTQAASFLSARSASLAADPCAMRPEAAGANRCAPTRQNSPSEPEMRALASSGPKVNSAPLGPFNSARS